MMTKSFVVIVLLSFFFIFLPCYATPASGADPDLKNVLEDIGKGIPEKCFTPPDLENIFLRACEKVLDDASQCSFAWSAFTLAFRFKDPDTVTKDDYKLFFELFPVKSPLYSAVFWSGVRKIVEQVSMHPSVSTSANQIASNIINNMATDGNVFCWCGNATASLDTVNPCSFTPVVAFWQAFSSNFGESAEGIVYWIGDGNREGGAYQNTTLFTEYGFPKLLYPRVYRLVAIVIHDCNETIVVEESEGCEEETLKVLEDQSVRKFGRIGGYGCATVCGNASDEQQISTLANHCLQIIREEQQKGNYISYIARHSLYVDSLYGQV